MTPRPTTPADIAPLHLPLPVSGIPAQAAVTDAVPAADAPPAAQEEAPAAAGTAAAQTAAAPGAPAGSATFAELWARAGESLAATATGGEQAVGEDGPSGEACDGVPRAGEDAGDDEGDDEAKGQAGTEEAVRGGDDPDADDPDADGPDDGNDAPENAGPGNDAPENAGPGNDALGNAGPGNDALGNAGPGNDALGNDEPEDAAPRGADAFAELWAMVGDAVEEALGESRDPSAPGEDEQKAEPLLHGESSGESIWHAPASGPHAGAPAGPDEASAADSDAPQAEATAMAPVPDATAEADTVLIPGPREEQQPLPGPDSGEGEGPSKDTDTATDADTATDTDGDFVEPAERDGPVEADTVLVPGIPGRPAEGEPPSAPCSAQSERSSKDEQPADATVSDAAPSKATSPAAASPGSPTVLMPGPRGTGPQGTDPQDGPEPPPALKTPRSGGPSGSGPRTGAKAATSAEGPGAGRARRRGPADPVRQVMHRHQALIAGAVDVWEIAAGLEAHGVTDVDARRLRHRDVFGLAEELYARVPRAGRIAEVPAGEREGAWLHPLSAARYLLPGAVCAVAVRLLPAETATALVLVAAYAVLRRGPLHAPGRAAALWACGLLALTSPTAPGLAASLVPAAYGAHWFAVRSRAQLAPSHGLDDFADAVRPRLAAVLAGYTAALVALLSAAGPVAAPAALGLLLFTTRLLALHGRAAAAATVLGTACAAEALYRLAAALAPGGPHTAAHALICGAAAAAAVVQAFRSLPRAAAHRPT